MKKNTRLKSFLPLLVLALILSACDFPSADVDDQVALGIAQTQIALTQAALDADGDGNGPETDEPQQPPPEPTPTNTLSPTETLTPTITLTPTPSTPMVSVSRNTNCRTGPGEPYEIIGALLQNEEAEVVGISSDGGTWIVENPDGAGECWLWGYYASVDGPTEGLPVHTPPPTPTPAFTWAGSWTTYNFVPGDPVDTLPMTVTVEDQAFTGVITLGGSTVNLTGTISDDHLSVSGTWTSPAHNGTFAYYALGANQFQGRGMRDDDVLAAWCGSRSGAGMPDPCLRE